MCLGALHVLRPIRIPRQLEFLRAAQTPRGAAKPLSAGCTFSWFQPFEVSMHQLASGDLYLGVGAAVGLALMTLVSIKLYRENVEMRRLMKERETAEFLD